ncbi:hypothetical protein CNMCM6106_000341 [Aspergillus hiratsukae]|uniref:Uncharacterized protein n=1 Tax=Aspergillus hiratsukae TaxID=1194566 RepID=A0A8H6PZ03_9EURO|nr:hypothetical protein CNMCM6106_000341 [Aspergillus hiratsukae]
MVKALPQLAAQLHDLLKPMVMTASSTQATTDDDEAADTAEAEVIQRAAVDCLRRMLGQPASRLNVEDPDDLGLPQQDLDRMKARMTPKGRKGLKKRFDEVNLGWEISLTLSASYWYLCGLAVGQRNRTHAGTEGYGPTGNIKFVLEVGIAESARHLASDARGWLETLGTTIQTVVTIYLGNGNYNDDTANSSPRMGTRSRPSRNFQDGDNLHQKTLRRR